MDVEAETDEILGRLAHALRTDDPEDPYAALVELTRAAAGALRSLPGPEAWRRVEAVAGALGLPAPAPGDPAEAAGLTPPLGIPLPALERETRLALQAPLEDLAGALEGVDREATRLLRELARARVPPGAGAVRFYVALARVVDQLLWAARYTAREPEAREALGPILEGALVEARALGADVYPAPGQRRHREGSEARCPVRALPAFGDEEGAIAWVDRHGFVLPDGRVEEAVVRVVRAPAPPYLPLLREGYRTLRREVDRLEEGPALVTAYRAWLDEQAALPDEERRAATLRYAATAVFTLARAEPAHEPLYQRFLSALEAVGSFIIPLAPDRLVDEERYELVLRPGAGGPRLLRPGFQTGGAIVQQRARVLADPMALARS